MNLKRIATITRKIAVEVQDIVLWLVQKQQQLAGGDSANAFFSTTYDGIWT